MIRVFFAAAVLLLSACQDADMEVQQTPVEQAIPVPAATNAAAATAARIGDWGVDLANRDVSLAPGDDFFRYASGTWLASYELPADKTSFGSFNALRDQSQERVRDLVEELARNAPEAGSVEQKIGDYYSSFLGQETINALGITPIQTDLDAIAAIETREDLARAFGRADLVATLAPISVGLEIDRLNPDRFIAGVSVSGMGLPDRDYYLEDTERFAQMREAYEAHIARMLDLVGYADADASPDTETAAAAVLALETAIAEQQWPRADRRNRDLTYNLRALPDIETEYADFPWQPFLAASGFTPEELNVRQPSAMAPLIEIINATDLDTWRAYLTYHLASRNAGYLSAEIDDASFDFYGRVLRGQPEQRERWRRAIRLVSGSSGLGDAIGQVYVERYFPAESKAMMETLVENLREALRQRIAALEWMTEDTKEYAFEKLASFRPKIGYPAEWRDFSSVSIDPQDLMGNVRQLRQYFQDDAISRLSQPTDRDEWFATAQTVNAFYNSQFNAITFPAGILEAPFFDPAADAAVNYGAIGAVIGHEMGHGFDDQGSKSDAQGIQRNWWSAEDRARFEARADILVEQYSGYEPVPGTFVDGKFTLGENIGDLGGVNVAYHAYQLSLDGREAPVIDGLSGDQRFFLAYAQVWRSKIRDEALVTRLKADPHSPARYRVNGVVRNVDAWYDAFDVTPEDALYLAPEDRVSIW